MGRAIEAWQKKSAGAFADLAPEPPL